MIFATTFFFSEHIRLPRLRSNPIFSKSYVEYTLYWLLSFYNLDAQFVRRQKYSERIVPERIERLSLLVNVLIEL
ncbi:hypothetical protein LEP1GSC108_4269 [Leptospira weilii str. UI 13098]|uniref:Uncharacterized protein n=1 Tax=Leptospira weilii str. UI 13098 TaxID=1088542 RepID=M6QCL0_9LEPT|nr:hypothetical protein LEP1GSC108_4269 [Leptospira weilii str. UI 13098]